jgi:hypothetical protein
MMKNDTLLRGRDLTMVLFGFWALTFLALGANNMYQAGRFFSWPLHYAGLISVLDHLEPRYALIQVSVWTDGHTLGFLEMTAGVFLLLIAGRYYLTRHAVSDSDRVHRSLGIIPVAFALAATYSVLDLARWRTDASFIPSALGIAALFTLFITPVLIRVWGVPASRVRLSAAMSQPIEFANLRAAKR